MEDFRDDDEAKKRADYVRSLTQSAGGFFAEYSYRNGAVFLRVSHRLTPDQATEYELALNRCEGRDMNTQRGDDGLQLDRLGCYLGLGAGAALIVEERLAWESAYMDSGLVFTRQDGGPLHPDTMTKAFARLAESSGLPRIRLHDLRHGWATNALRAGVPAKVVSEILGHATVGFTLDIYTHAIPAMQEDAVDRVAGMIFGR